MAALVWTATVTPTPASARESSSSTRMYEMKSAPAPPSSSGTQTPISPSPPSLEKSSRGKVWSLPRAMLNAYRYQKLSKVPYLTMLKEGLAMRKSMDLSWTQMLMAANTPMLLKMSFVDGNMESGVMASGQAVGVIDDLPSCKELIDRTIAEAEAVLENLEG